MKKRILTFLFFTFTIYVQATFTLTSATIITQTNTDTDLSGLASISGVTLVQVGLGTDSEYTIYDIGDRQLIINGNLTIDASKEMLLVGSAAPRSIISVIGTLNIKDFETINGFTSYLQRIAIRTTYDRNDYGQNFSLDVSDSGTFNMQGGGIECSSSIKFYPNSTVNIQDGRIELLATPDPQYQIRQFSNNLTANNFKMVKYAMTMVGTPLQFDGYMPTIADEGISFSSSSSSIQYNFRDYSGGGRGNRLDLGLWSNRKGKIINSSDGTNLIVEEHLIGNNSSTGTWQIIKEIAPKIIDEKSVPIQNAKMFIRDTNNNKRVDGNGYTFTSDRTYFKTSNASGLIPTTEILTGAVNHLSTGFVVFDRRSKNDNTDDEFDIYFYHYNKILTKSIQKLKGISELTYDWTMFEDTNITETDATVVAAYSTIDNLGQLYDYAKYWKQLNQTNLEIPSINELLIINESSLLNIGDYNLVIDATASAVFSVDTNSKTITIKSNTILTTSKFKGIKTTANITLYNGATLEHGYIDSNGINKFVHLKWNQSTTNDVSIINNDNLTVIYFLSPVTTVFKSHFLVPSTVPTNGIEVQVDILSNGPNLYKELIPEEDINFVRLDIDLIDVGTELNQLEMLKISERLLAKVEAIKSAMNNTTTPTLIINETITTAFNDGTLQNQETILMILKRLLSKVTATREAVKPE
ncbi:hypothetical protein [Polaribacter sp. SA4-12]|uniref:hypothetical protein n=1 Tax=Polaribacter sp. SA4-12 TaxID=1312072 RepID=UPI000B3CC452|nr:hypothetical protein [Polaribacter sp. SA4-12]ARV13949.1 hypothetical protein BTO07_01775 [Polaribacter sp. SA4-12]